MEEEIDDVFSVHFLMGFTMTIAKQIEVNSNFKYAFLKPTLHATLTDLVMDEEYFRTEEIELGVKAFSICLNVVF